MEEIDERPPVLRLVQQYLFENGFSDALQKLEEESGETFNAKSFKMGGLLEHIVHEHYELEASKLITESDIEVKETENRLMSEGDGTYVQNLDKTLDNIHGANILSFAWSYDPESSIFATGSSDKTIKLSNSKTSQVLHTMTFSKSPIISLDFNPKYHDLLLCSGLSGSTHVVDTKALQEIQNIAPTGLKPVVQVKWYHDGLTFATAGHDHIVCLYRATDVHSPFQLVQQFTFGGSVETITFIEKELVVGVREDNYIHTIDLNTLKKDKFNMNQTLDDHVSFTPMYLSMKPEERDLLLVSTDKDRIILYKMGNSTPVRNYYGAENDMWSTPRHAWHPSGKYIYSTSHYHKLHCWEVGTQKMISKMDGHKASVRDLKQHPYENMLGSVSFDKTVKLWTPK